MNPNQKKRFVNFRLFSIDGWPPLFKIVEGPFSIESSGVQLLMKLVLHLSRGHSIFKSINCFITKKWLHITNASAFNVLIFPSLVSRCVTRSANPIKVKGLALIISTFGYFRRYSKSKVSLSTCNTSFKVDTGHSRSNFCCLSPNLNPVSGFAAYKM